MGTRSRDAFAASRKKQGAWRTASLCVQIQRALETTLASMADERLASLVLEAVIPDGRASRMLILLRTVSPRDVSQEDIRAALAGAEGRFRSDVASAIHRKRTPHLHYVVLGEHEWGDCSWGPLARGPNPTDTVAGDPDE